MIAVMADSAVSHGHADAFQPNVLDWLGSQSELAELIRNIITHIETFAVQQYMRN